MTLGDLGPSADVQFNFNKAEGGIVPEGTEYEVTTFRGIETWKYHEFHSTDATGLNVISNPRDFKILVIGGGGGGGGTNGPGGGGGQGGNHVETESPLNLGEHPVIIGAAGGAGKDQGGGGGGGASHLRDANGNNLFTGSGGAGGAAGGAHGGCDAGGPLLTTLLCDRPNISFQTTIKGPQETYSQNGCSACHSGGGSASRTRGGNGIGSNNFNYAMTGGTGLVIIAYRTG